MKRVSSSCARTRWGLAAATVAAVCTLAGCSSVEQPADAAQVRGQLLLEQYDCGSCHVIPGVRRANGKLGPSLETFARRVYIAGEVPNQPELLVRWIPHPKSLVPDTLMLEQPMPPEHARDMGTYLMSLR
jgi:cytochrome c